MGRARVSRKLGRIKRGENYAPGRYWLSFMVFSVVVHVVTMAVMSDAALSFLQTLRKPQPPAQALLYVNILYAPPAPLPSGAPPQPPVKKTSAPAAPARAQRHHTPDKGMPKKPEVVPPDDVSTGQAPAAPAQQVDDTLHVKVSEVTKARKEKKPRTVEEPVVRDTAIRETAVLDSVGDGTIQLITGTKKTNISLADMPRDDSRDHARPPREVLKRYSTVSTASSDKVSAPPRSRAAQDYALVTPKAPSLENLAPPMQTEASGSGAHAAPVPAALPTLPNSSSITIAGPDIVQPADSGPISPTPPTLKVHTSIPPPPVFTGHSSTTERAAVLSAVQAGPPAVPPAPPPSPTKVITIKGADKGAGPPPKIKITSPREGITDKSLIDIAGVASGEGISSVTLSIRGEEREVLVRDGAFKATAQLDEGSNEIKAKVRDSEGRVSRDRVFVTYVPAITAARISFTSPVNGGTIDAMSQKGLLISGSVEGKGIKTVRVYLNKSVMDIDVTDGRFSRLAPIEAEENLLYAEATDGGKTYRSEKISFRVLNLYPKDLTVRMEFSGKGDAPRLKYRWVPHPLSEKAGRIPAPPEFMADAGPDSAVVSVGEAVPGIYTVGVEYNTPPGEVREATFKVTLYGYDQSRKKTRTIGPVKLAGKGFIPAVRVLLPEKVFWEDDSWFSGRVESGEGIMKFKEPEGIEWKEQEEE